MLLKLTFVDDDDKTAPGWIDADMIVGLAGVVDQPDRVVLFKRENNVRNVVVGDLDTVADQINLARQGGLEGRLHQMAKGEIPDDMLDKIVGAVADDLVAKGHIEPPHAFATDAAMDQFTARLYGHLAPEGMSQNWFEAVVGPTVANWTAEQIREVGDWLTDDSDDMPPSCIAELSGHVSGSQLPGAGAE